MTKRRAKGDGSVHKRTDGTWASSILLPNGRRKYFYGKTRSVVAERLRLARIKLDRGSGLLEDKRTVAEYLDWWIEDQKNHIATSTWKSYESKTRIHLKPSIGSIRLTRLTPMDVRDMISAKTGSYSAKQVNHIHDVLHAALEDARMMELIERNVASLVETPRIVPTERKALTVEQANALLRVLEGDRLQPLFRMYLTMGLRPGEGLGLQWKSIDFDARTLRVESTLQRHEGAWSLKHPKTPASKQTLPLPGFLADILKQHQERQHEERIAAREMWQEWGLVFPRPDGQPAWYSDVGRALKRACRKAGIPEVTLHELRHSTPSILLALGVDQRVIMQILRHSTIVLTANLYTHVADPLVREALDRIDGALDK